MDNVRDHKIVTRLAQSLLKTFFIRKVNILVDVIICSTNLKCFYFPQLVVNNC